MSSSLFQDYPACGGDLDAAFVALVAGEPVAISAPVCPLWPIFRIAVM